MPANRRQVADDLAEDAHSLLAGAPPYSIIALLEYRIQDLQEISDRESSTEKETEKKKHTDSGKA